MKFYIYMENYDSIKKDFLINLLELSSNSINSFSQTTLLIQAFYVFMLHCGA